MAAAPPPHTDRRTHARRTHAQQQHRSRSDTESSCTRSRYGFAYCFAFKLHRQRGRKRRDESWSAPLTSLCAACGEKQQKKTEPKALTPQQAPPTSVALCGARLPLAVWLEQALPTRLSSAGSSFPCRPRLMLRQLLSTHHFPRPAHLLRRSLSRNVVRSLTGSRGEKAT